MRGKYSPTVTAAYMRDQDWHRKFRGTHGAFDADGARCEHGSYDVDGYDSYGYNKDDVDRAGNNENDYIPGFEDEHGDYHDQNDAYDYALSVWTFDGVRPVEKA